MKKPVSHLSAGKRSDRKTAKPLERELETFERRKPELLASDEGQFALVHGDEIVGTYHDEQDAITQGYRRFGNVPFLVKQVVSVEIPASFVNIQLEF